MAKQELFGNALYLEKRSDGSLDDLCSRARKRFTEGLSPTPQEVLNNMYINYSYLSCSKAVAEARGELADADRFGKLANITGKRIMDLELNEKQEGEVIVSVPDEEALGRAKIMLGDLRKRDQVYRRKLVESRLQFEAEGGNVYNYETDRWNKRNKVITYGRGALLGAVQVLEILLDPKQSEFKCGDLEVSFNFLKAEEVEKAEEVTEVYRPIRGMGGF